MKKATLAFGIVVGLGFFAGCAASEGPVDEESTEPTDERSQALCCIEFTCPSDGESFIGCKSGPPISGAFHACQQHCDEGCESSGLICD